MSPEDTESETDIIRCTYQEHHVQNVNSSCNPGNSSCNPGCRSWGIMMETSVIRVHQCSFFPRKCGNTATCLFFNVIIPLFSVFLFYVHPQLFPGLPLWRGCHLVLHIQTRQAFSVSQQTKVFLLACI